MPMKTIKKIIFILLLLTSVTICFPNEKREQTESIVYTFMYSGKFIKIVKKGQTLFINKNAVGSIIVFDDYIYINDLNGKGEMFHFNKYNISLPLDSVLVIEQK